MIEKKEKISFFIYLYRFNNRNIYSWSVPKNPSPDTMSSHRPYRPALGIDAALEEISKNKGIFYDPEVVDICIRLVREKGFQF